MMRIKYNDVEPTDGLILVKEQGLVSSETDVSLTEFAAISGGVVSRCRVPSREIVLTYAVVDVAPEEARQRLHNIFQYGSAGTLEVITKSKDVVATAYVKRVEGNIWSPTQYMDVTLVCPDPYLYDKNETVYEALHSGAGWLVDNAGESVGFIAEVSGQNSSVTVNGQTVSWENAIGLSNNGYLDTREGHLDLYAEYTSSSGTTRTTYVSYLTGWNFPQIPNGTGIMVEHLHAYGELRIRQRWMGL